MLVAAGNDLAYVVQAVAPNFVWKTTDFPYARKGYLWSIVLQILLGKFTHFLSMFKDMLTALFLSVALTATIQLLLWRDKRRAARSESEASLVASEGSASLRLEGSDDDDKRAVRAVSKEVTL